MALYKHKIQQSYHKPIPIFFSLLTAETGAAAAAPCAATLGGFRPLLGYPDFPLLLAIMPNHLFHSKQPPHLINSSLKWGISQNPNLFYLEFYGCFLYGLCLDDQIDSYCAIFIEFGDVWSYGYLIKRMIFMILQLLNCCCRKFWKSQDCPKILKRLL